MALFALSASPSVKTIAPTHPSAFTSRLGPEATQSIAQQGISNSAADATSGGHSNGAIFGVAAAFSLIALSHKRRAMRVTRKSVITSNKEGLYRFVQATDVKTAVAARAEEASTDGFDPTKEVGICDPLGFWDPLNLMKKRNKRDPWAMGVRSGDWEDKETFYHYRAAEIKHGRLAMMAVAGLLAGSFAKWYGFEDVPDGFAALATAKGGGGFGCVVLAASFLEVDLLKQDPSKNPGDFGDPAGVLGMTPSASYDDAMRTKEINHGRLAMSAVATELLFEYHTGRGVAQQFDTFRYNGVWGLAIPLFFTLLLAWNSSSKSRAAVNEQKTFNVA